MAGLFDDLIPGAQVQGGMDQAARGPVNPAAMLAFAQGGALPHRAPQAPAGGHFTDLIPQSSGQMDFRQHGVLGAANTVARTIARGVPVVGQFADEADAATNAALAPYVEPLLDKIPGHDRSYDLANTPDFAGRYARAKAMQGGMDQQVDRDHPMLSLLGQGVGAVGGTIAGAKYLSPMTQLLSKAAPAAGLVPTMAANAADAGLVGAAMGYGNGNGGVADPSRLQGAQQGGEFGAAFGAAAKPAGMVGSALWRSTGGKLADMLAGKANIGAPAAEQAAPTASYMADALSGPTARPSATAQPMPSAPNLATDTAAAQAAVPPTAVAPSTANAAYDRIHQALARGGASPEQAIAQVGKLGPFGMLADVNAPTQDFARTVADTPGQGGQIAKDALNLRQSGTLNRGQYSTRPASQRIGDTLAESLGVQGPAYADQEAALIARQQAQSAPAYAKAYSAQPVALQDLKDFATSPMFSKAYARARSISQSEFVPQADGSSKLIPLPPKPPGTLDWRTLDLMKQGMDDMYREGATSGIGANAQRATSGYTKNFVAALDKLNPDYATARAAFSGPQNAMDAMKSGYDYMGETPQAARATIGDLDPGDQHMFRVGAAQAVRDQLGSNPNTYNAAAKAGVNTDVKLAKLQKLFPSQQAFGDFADMLKNEQTMFDTRARVMGGSLTSKNLGQEADAGNNPLEALGSLAELHAEPVTGSMKIIAKLLQAGNGQKMSEPVSNTAASILFNMNNDAYPAFQKGLSDAARRAALAKALAGGAAPAGGYAGAATGQSQQ